jgi:hypothetical protein
MDMIRESNGDLRKNVAVQSDYYEWGRLRGWIADLDNGNLNTILLIVEWGNVNSQKRKPRGECLQLHDAKVLGNYLIVIKCYDMVSGVRNQYEPQQPESGHWCLLYSIPENSKVITKISENISLNSRSVIIRQFCLRRMSPSLSGRPPSDTCIAEIRKATSSTTLSTST